MLRKLAILIFTSLAIYTYYLKRELDSTTELLTHTVNNLEYYQNKFSLTEDKNRVLLLTIQDLQYSKDSVLNKLELVREEHKIKDRHTKQELYIKTVIKDSIRTIVIEPNFKERLKLNPMTYINIQKSDSILDVKLDIINELFLYVTKKRVYKNKRKNWFDRLIHFDWEKIDATDYEIINSNPIIKVTDTRIVEIN